MILITEAGPIGPAGPVELYDIPPGRIYAGVVAEATGPAVRKVYYDADGNLVCEVLND